MARSSLARRKTDTLFRDSVRACKKALRSVMVFSLFVNLLMLTGPFFMLQVYDRVLASRSLPTLVALCILVVALYFFMALLDVLRSRIVARAGLRLDDQLAPRVIDAMMFHAANKTPNVGSVPARDLDTVRSFVSGPGLIALFDAPWVPVYLLVVFLFHPVLGYLALAGAVLLFVLMLANEWLTRKPMAALGQQSQVSHQATEELYQNAELIRALGMGARMRARWMGEHDRTLVNGLSVSDRNGLISGVTKASRLILQSAILAVGAYLVIQQEILPGVMIAASIIFARALAPVEQTIAHWRNVLAARKAWETLRTLLTQTPADAEPLALPEPKGFIAVENVSLIAKGRDDPLLQGLNFELTPGEVLAVLGPTGAGKSTLAKVLIGTLVPQKGRVTIDGAALDQWDRDRLGAHVGYLTQDSEMFTGTVAENISRFDPDAKMEDVIAAAQMAELHSFILDLPNGYNTEIGPTGHPFSGGERQRIGLARAVFGSPAIAILDEPNANLDAQGEAAVIKCIKRLKANGTAVIVIAHRPSVIQAVDKVLYLRGGRQIGVGPRDEMLKKILVNPGNRPTPIRPESDGAALGVASREVGGGEIPLQTDTPGHLTPKTPKATS
ncbi:MAG: type I secretion system permease/ATPase [Pseudomonadota bacterium]